MSTAPATMAATPSAMPTAPPAAMKPATISAITGVMRIIGSAVESAAVAKIEGNARPIVPIKRVVIAIVRFAINVVVRRRPGDVDRLALDVGNLRLTNNRGGLWRDNLL